MKKKQLTREELGMPMPSAGKQPKELSFADNPANWRDVQSSQFNKIAYDPEREQMFICFHSATYYYTYAGVPQKLYDLFVAADQCNKDLDRLSNGNLRASLGTLFHYTLKINSQTYPYEKKAFAVTGASK